MTSDAAKADVLRHFSPIVIIERVFAYNLYVQMNNTAILVMRKFDATKTELNVESD